MFTRSINNSIVLTFEAWLLIVVGGNERSAPRVERSNGFNVAVGGCAVLSTGGNAEKEFPDQGLEGWIVSYKVIIICVHVLYIEISYFVHVKALQYRVLSRKSLRQMVRCGFKTI